VFIIAPDIRRLANLLLFNRKVEPVEAQPFFKRKWLNRSLLALQILFGLYLIGTQLNFNYKLHKQSGQKPPLYGIWDVEEFTVDGQARPPLLTDETRWRRLIFDDYGLFIIQPVNGRNQFYRLNLNPEDKTLAIGKGADPEWKADFSFKEPEPDQLTLEGTIDKHPAQVKLVRFDECKFLLKSRGFHWLQEYPFNR